MEASDVPIGPGHFRTTRHDIRRIHSLTRSRADLSIPDMEARRDVQPWRRAGIRSGEQDRG